MAAPSRLPVASLLLALLGGCAVPHYVVVRDGAPLYADLQGETVLARLPRYHHEALPAAPEPAGARLPVVYRGRRGYVPADDVRVFSYLDPSLDGGSDRHRVVRRELRELQLAEVGDAWPDDVVTAVRRDRVLPGMTREQVELAWGWPQTVERGERPGGERWVYRDRGQARVQRWVDGWSAPAFWDDDPWRAGAPLWRGGYRWSHGPCYGGYVTLTVPVEVSRTVEYDAEGRVVDVRVERHLSDS